MYRMESVKYCDALLGNGSVNTPRARSKQRDTLLGKHIPNTVNYQSVITYSLLACI
jgi:hypothetical protein